MLSKDEFGTAARVFLDQLSVLCLQQNPESLTRLPGFTEVVQEALQEIGEGGAAPSDVLPAACGIVHEFVMRNWDEVLRSTYAHYEFVNRGDDPIEIWRK